MTKGRQTNWLSWAKANALAKAIELYWQRRGETVTMKLVKIRESDPPIYAIRSDMVGGRPRKV